jgi:hypothetical protein
VAATELIYDLVSQPHELSAAEADLLQGFTYCLQKSIERGGRHLVFGLRDIGTGTRTRLSAKDLMTEVERVLTKASGSMSLLERLQRDSQLREDLVELLQVYEKQAVNVEQL